MDDSRSVSCSDLSSRSKLCIDDALLVSSNQLTIGDIVVDTYSHKDVMSHIDNDRCDGKAVADNADDDDDDADPPQRYMRVSATEKWVARLRSRYNPPLPWPTSLGQAITTELDRVRGKRTRTSWKGCVLPVVSIKVGDQFLNVVNKARPITIEATVSNVELFWKSWIQDARQAIHDSSTDASTAPSVASVEVATPRSVKPNSRASRPIEAEVAEEASNVELPRGVYWCTSKVAFYVKKTQTLASMTFIVRSKQCRDIQLALDELALLRKRACHYKDTGNALPTSSEAPVMTRTRTKADSADAL